MTPNATTTAANEIEARASSDGDMCEVAPVSANDLPLLIIKPTPGWRAIDIRELWRYRELLYFLTWRDVKVRYKQTALGAAWAIIQPFMTMVVFTIFFGRFG
jgi:lipopolysaccharide transport system permease protein